MSQLGPMIRRLASRCRHLPRLRPGSLVMLLAVGWALILPTVAPLFEPEMDVRYRSMFALFYVWPPSAIGLLLGLLLNVVPWVKTLRVPRQVLAIVLLMIVPAALRQLYQYGYDLSFGGDFLGPAAVPSLLRAMAEQTAKENRITPRSEAAQRKLLGIGEAGVPRLIAALSDPDWAMRESAARILGQLGRGAEAARDPLARLLKDPDPQVRSAAATAVLDVSPTTRFDVPILIDIVEGALDLDRNQAVIALEALGPQATPAVPALTKALSANFWAVRKNAARALSKFGQAATPAIPALEAMAKDRDPDLRTAAADALDRIRAAVPPQ